MLLPRRSKHVRRKVLQLGWGRRTVRRVGNNSRWCGQTAAASREIARSGAFHVAVASLLRVVGGAYFPLFFWFSSSAHFCGAMFFCFVVGSLWWSLVVPLPLYWLSIIAQPKRLHRGKHPAWWTCHVPRNSSTVAENTLDRSHEARSSASRFPKRCPRLSMLLRLQATSAHNQGLRRWEDSPFRHVTRLKRALLGVTAVCVRMRKT